MIKKEELKTMNAIQHDNKYDAGHEAGPDDCCVIW